MAPATFYIYNIMLRLILIVGTGGFIGTVGRFLLSRVIHANTLTSFPLGTFTVNIIGCLLIGIIYGISGKSNIISPDLRLFLTVGVCGGFTSFSTFSSENIFLLRDGNFMLFALYTSLSVFLCLVAVYLGNLITKLY
ncbi:MAG: fluoride efflux transporter CrcB [Tenuifilaceae bacterium]|jgi:CrcB protein|nr:fluoride efflux transporter CrcB [Tenuifilaceae bacterium]